jgi:hypothetical protein
VDGDALHVVVGDFDLASIEATANLNVERCKRAVLKDLLCTDAVKVSG